MATNRALKVVVYRDGRDNARLGMAIRLETVHVQALALVAHQRPILYAVIQQFYRVLIDLRRIRIMLGIESRLGPVDGHERIRTLRDVGTCLSII